MEFSCTVVGVSVAVLDAASELPLLEVSAEQQALFEHNERELDIFLCRAKEEEIQWDLCRLCYNSPISAVLLDCGKLLSLSSCFLVQRSLIFNCC